jgi:Transglycosylase SLT domain
MNPLIAIAANLFPEIMKAIAGDRAQKVAATVSKVVADAVGTDDPVQAERTLAQDPAVAAQLRTDLARIALEETRLRLDAEQRQRETAVSELKVRTDADQSRRQTGLDRHRADLEDTSGARGMQRALASSQSGVAWVAPALSLVVTVGFFLMLLLFIIAKNRLESGPPPVIPDGLSVQSLTPDQIRAFSPARSDFVLQIINICVGALATAFATVMSFWLGSSQSSRVKDQLVSEMQTERATQTSKILTEAANVMTGAGAPHPPEAPASRPAPSPPSPPSPASGETGTGTPVKPAPPGLLAEVVPDLIKPHRHFPTAVSWALTADGIAVDGAAAQGTAGQPTTVRKIWQTYGDRCTAAARRYGVPVELIVATIATESGGDSNARRPEPKIGDESVGLMQTLVATARGATGRSSLRGDDLLDPATRIRPSMPGPPTSPSSEATRISTRPWSPRPTMPGRCAATRARRTGGSSCATRGERACTSTSSSAGSRTACGYRGPTDGRRTAAFPASRPNSRVPHLPQRHLPPHLPPPHRRSTRRRPASRPDPPSGRF